MFSKCLNEGVIRYSVIMSNTSKQQSKVIASQAAISSIDAVLPACKHYVEQEAAKAKSSKQAESNRPSSQPEPEQTQTNSRSKFSSFKSGDRSDA